MRAAIIAILSTVAMQAGAECGNLCDRDWWKSATTADVKAELDAGASLSNGISAPVPLKFSWEDQNLPVKISGKFSAEYARILSSQKKKGAGYRIISVFETEGRRLLVDRGFLKIDQDFTEQSPEFSTVVGNLYYIFEVDDFTPEPDFEKNLWFARDIDKLAQHLSAEPIYIVASSIFPENKNIIPWAIDFEYDESCGFLVGSFCQRDRYNLAPLHYAASEGNTDQINILLTGGADIMEPSRYGRTPLHEAAYNSGPENLKTLLLAGADVMALDKFHSTPLHEAAYGGNKENVQVLLATFAQVLARTKMGETPLHEAAAGGSAEIIQILLASGANIMARTQTGLTPLHYLSVPFSNPTPSAVQALLDSGADVNARDENGITAIHLAAMVHSHLVVQVLLDAGANAKIRDNYGKTPWDYAQDNEDLKGTKAYWALNEAQYD